ncbi:hypothetical protein F5144DRAFT_203461 [Chaetomium tenue]|uniref:Uncharacterized protein n=1 Tax=Chaetomium tenue TaxID=1854479 RepID=A0ACB7PIY6_9PEZI|nr:hypothetical protein F5144DRAFT_203461 [Chaetomium globosum]
MAEHRGAPQQIHRVPIWVIFGRMSHSSLPLPFLAFCALSAFPNPSFDSESSNPQHSLSRFFDSPTRGPRSLLFGDDDIDHSFRVCVDRQLSFLGAIVICRSTRLSARLQASQLPILHRIENRGIGFCVRKQHIRYARRLPGHSLVGLVNQTAVNCHPWSGCEACACGS